eukprot:Rmarinus@m.20474
MVGFTFLKSGQVQAPADFESAQARLQAKDVMSSNPPNVNVAIEKMARQRNFACAIALLMGVIEKEGVQNVNESTYNAILSSCAEVQKAYGVNTCVNILLTAGIKPFASTLPAVMRPLLKEKQMLEAWKVIQHFSATFLDDAELSTSELAACSSLLDACDRSGNNQFANLSYTILQTMRARSHIPDVHRYQAVVQKYLKLRRFSEALEVINEAYAAGLCLDNASLAQFVAALVVSAEKSLGEKATDIVLDLHNRSAELGHPIDESVWSTLVSNLVGLKRTSAARDAFLCAAQKAGVAISERVHMNLMQAFVTVRRPEDIVTTLSTLEEAKLCSDNSRWVTAVSILTKAKYLSHAKQMIEAAAVHRMPEDDVLCHFFSAHVKKGSADDALNILRNLERIHSKAAHRPVVWKTLLNALVLNQQVPQAFTLLALMKSIGITADYDTVRQLTLTAIDSGFEDEAITLLKEARTAGYKVSEDHYRQALESLLKRKSSASMDRSLCVVREMRMAGYTQLQSILDKQILARLLIEEQERRVSAEASNAQRNSASSSDSTATPEPCKRKRTHSLDKASNTHTSEEVKGTKPAVSIPGTSSTSLSPNTPVLLSPVLEMPQTLSEAQADLQRTSSLAASLHSQWQQALNQCRALSEAIERLKVHEGEHSPAPLASGPSPDTGISASPEIIMHPHASLRLLAELESSLLNTEKPQLGDNPTEASGATPLASRSLSGPTASPPKQMEAMLVMDEAYVPTRPISPHLAPSVAPSQGSDDFIML